MMKGWPWGRLPGYMPGPPGWNPGANAGGPLGGPGGGPALVMTGPKPAQQSHNIAMSRMIEKVTTHM